MLEKFKALAWHFQLIVLVVIASLVYFSVWYFVTSGTRAEIQELEDQVAQKTSQNEAARKHHSPISLIKNLEISCEREKLC